MRVFDIFYLTYIAFRDSAFMKVFTLIIFYYFQYINSLPKKNWYNYDGDTMPRYNLNHQDVDTIISGLDHMAMNAHSSREHSRITNLKDRLLSKLSSKNQQDQDDELDPWEAFKGD